MLLRRHEEIGGFSIGKFQRRHRHVEFDILRIFLYEDFTCGTWTINAYATRRSRLLTQDLDQITDHVLITENRHITLTDWLHM